MSLDDFFGNKETKLTKFKNVFYFNNQDKDNFYAEWLDKIPHDCNFIKNISWREFKMNITLCGHINTLLPDYKNNINKNNKNKIPLLKSHLQKNVRRNETMKAIKSAKEFLDIDFGQFIRRLSIIMLEDCVLHESYNVICWMTAAFGSWNPNKDDILYLLSIVEYLSNLEYLDERNILNFDFKKNIKNINSLEGIYKDLLYSMRFRISYGGMDGDKKMISFFCDKWLKRFQGKYLLEKDYIDCIKNPLSNINSIEKYINIKYLDKYDLYSIDFHNNPKMIESLLNLYKNFNYSKEDIKKAIWLFRSSLTKKQPLYIIDDGNYLINDNRNLKENEIYENKYKAIFNLIEIDVNVLSNKYINEVISS